MPFYYTHAHLHGALADMPGVFGFIAWVIMPLQCLLEKRREAFIYLAKLRSEVGCAYDSRAGGPGLDTRSATYFLSLSANLRRAVVSYWRKYVHEILINCLEGLSLPRKCVVW